MCSKEIRLNPKGFRSPSEYNLLFDELKIKTSDNIVLFGWLVYSSKENLKESSTIVYFQENAGSKHHYIFTTIISNQILNLFITLNYQILE